MSMTLAPVTLAARAALDLTCGSQPNDAKSRAAASGRNSGRVEGCSTRGLSAVMKPKYTAREPALARWGSRRGAKSAALPLSCALHPLHGHNLHNCLLTPLNRQRILSLRCPKSTSLGPSILLGV